MGLALGHSRCKQPVAAQSIIKNAFGPSGIPDGLFLASKETSMIEITQVNVSLDEAGDENPASLLASESPSASYVARTPRSSPSNSTASQSTLAKNETSILS
mgnify:CR=1 FL=1